jgi:hypothetical protein
MTTYYTERDGRYYRAGLRYEDEGDGTWRFEPDGPFFVDGIRYETPFGADVIYRRPMVEALQDSGRRAVFSHQPVTEEELDRWVRHG